MAQPSEPKVMKLKILPAPSPQPLSPADHAAVGAQIARMNAERNREPPPATPETLTAYHEAGHFVAQVVLGIGPADVLTIRRVGDVLGRMGVRLRGDLDSPEFGEAGAVVMYAGWAAQLTLAPDDPDGASRGADDDDATAECFLAVAVNATEAECRARAQCLVREHWGAVEAVARQLLEHETLAEAAIAVLAETIARGHQ